MEIIGKITFPDSGEVMEYSSKESYLNALKSELYSQGVTGAFKYETVKKTPELMKEIEDIIYGEYGEENPRSLEYYQEKYQNEIINPKSNTMEQSTDLEQLNYLKNQLKYLGFGESEKLHKNLENGINSEDKKFIIQTSSDKTLPENKVDFNIKFNKSEKGGVFLNSYSATLSNNKGENVTQNFTVSKENAFTAKEAVNLLEGRSVKIEFDNPKTAQKETAFVKLNFAEEKNKYGNYNFQTFHQNYGVDAKQIVEKSNLIFDKPEYKDSVIKSLEKGNVVKVKFELEDKTIEGKAVLNPQYKNLNLYDSDMNRLNTNKPLQGMDNDNKHEKSNVREQSMSRGI